jgi:hypothetical protein
MTKAEQDFFWKKLTSAALQIMLSKSDQRTTSLMISQENMKFIAHRFVPSTAHLQYPMVAKIMDVVVYTSPFVSDQEIAQLKHFSVLDF